LPPTLLEPLCDRCRARGGRHRYSVTAHEAHIILREEHVAIQSDIREGSIHPAQHTHDAGLVYAADNTLLALDEQLGQLTVFQNGYP
jgi:hypothetical protein